MTAKQDTLLMKDGIWELRRHVSVSYTLNSYIVHMCPGYEEKRYWYSLPIIDTLCAGCQEYPPEGIMGLWKLHNMDYIQAGKSY